MNSDLRGDPKFLVDKSDIKNEKDLKIKSLIPTLDGPKPKRSGFNKEEIK